MSLLRCTRSAVRSLALCALVAPALALQDPFLPGERWSAAPAATDSPWSPEDVAFAGDGAFVWAALRGGDASLHLFDAVARGTQGPRGVVPRFANEPAVAAVAAGRRGDRVFALRQAQGPTPYRRVPVVSAFDPRVPVAGAPMAPAWVHDMGLAVNGAVRLAADRQGELVVAAAWDDTRAVTRVDLLDGGDGALRARVELPAIALNALAVAADGGRIALVAGQRLYVLGPDGTQLHVQALASSTTALALSANGSTVVFGQLGSLRTITDLFGFGYGPGLTLAGAATELPARVDVSDDGTLIAAGWWDYAGGHDARLEVFDTIFGFPLASLDVPGNGSVFQNLPVAVRITADGRRAAMGTWGNGTDAEVAVLDVGGFGATLTVDTAGSVRALALDATGTRLAVAHKDVHAQAFGATGALRLVDTGERMLQTVEVPRLGGTLALAARRGGATGGFFLMGEPAAPQTFPGVVGQLLLDRRRLQVLPSVVDGAGRMDLALPIGTDPALAGIQLHLQAAFRTPQGLELSGNVERPFVLR